MVVAVDGVVAPGFEAVRDQFVANFDDIEVGASLCVYCEGKPVVDLWGGWQDRDQTRAWQRDTLVNVYSTTKGMGSLAIACLFDEGLIDYEAPVADYWPEFAAAGKQDVTVAQLLSHQAGLCGVEQPLTVEDLYDHERMARLLAAQAPLWPPGEGAGYHAVTWGFLPGELVRRITGKTLGQYFHEKVAAPLGADFYIGLPASELGRVADMIGPNHARLEPPAVAPVRPPPLFRIALQNPSISPFKHASSTPWRQAEIAAANGQANGRGIARIYGALAQGGEIDGIRVVSPAAIDAATRVEVDDTVDKVTGTVMRRSRGFILAHDGNYGPGTHSFGHAGAGGSTGFADPDRRLGFGYAMNQMQPGAPEATRAGLLIAATYAALGE